MFTPIDRLPIADSEERRKVRDRWDDDTGRRTHETVVALLRDHPRKNFLERAHEAGRLPILKDAWDLRGLHLVSQDFTLGDGDTFMNIDFSYGRLTHVIFRDAVFPQSYMAFGRVFGCRFVNCLFGFTTFYGTTFEDCVFESCDFIEHNEFLNCDYKNLRFERCFFGHPLFRDCRFDSRCRVNRPREVPVSDFKVSLENGILADFYLGISEAFRDGSVFHLADAYLFEGFRATRRFNTPARAKPLLYLREVTTGYGVKPARVVVTMAAVLVCGTFWFAYRLPWREALLLASGAMLTFGASTDRLQKLPMTDVGAYLTLAFAGVMLTALFVTTLARRIFTQR